MVKVNVSMTLDEYNQLKSYINAVSRDGWYYSPKDQFFKRHESIKKLFGIEAEAVEG